MSEKKTIPQKEIEKKAESKPAPKEIGGYEHKPEPTRYGDWETNGRCSDF